MSQETQTKIAETPSKEAFIEWRNSGVGQWYFQWLQLNYQQHAERLLFNTGKDGSAADIGVAATAEATAARVWKIAEMAGWDRIGQDMYLAIHGTLEGSKWAQEDEVENEQ